MLEIHTPIKVFTTLDLSGDVAHFFLTLIWTNETGAIMKSEPDWQLNLSLKTLKIERQQWYVMIFT